MSKCIQIIQNQLSQEPKPKNWGIMELLRNYELRNDEVSFSGEAMPLSDLKKGFEIYGNVSTG